MSHSISSVGRTSHRVHRALRALLWLIGALLIVWATVALWFDFPVAPSTVAPCFVVLVIVLSLGLRRKRWGPLVPLVAVGCVLAWWSSLRPSLDRVWQEDVSRLAYAEVENGTVTMHNVRNFDYPRGKKQIPRWETRSFSLSDVVGMDIAVNYWGSPWIAHPIIIFRIRDQPPLAFSIETRQEESEKYSPIAGFFRQYELIFIAGDERDLLRVRTGYRAGEDIYLYRATAAPALVRTRLLEYIQTINQLHRKARWYNAVTSNCTTAIRSMQQEHVLPLDWRLLINGKGDEMLYSSGLIDKAGLPFPELKQRAYINPAALAAHDDPEYSRLIRIGRPGFGASD